jgi:hypothetical protein
MSAMTQAVNELATSLNNVAPGEVANIADLEKALSAAWDDLAGPGVGGMDCWKLFGRMENVVWQPPLLSFVIERHGGTVNGSTRAELQHWNVNLDTMTAEITKTGHRQLEPMAKRVNVEPIKEEIVKKILAGQNDPRLTWRGKAVHVVISRVFPNQAGAKRTVEGRRRRLREAIKKELMGHGWCCEDRNVFRKPVAQDGSS